MMKNVKQTNDRLGLKKTSNSYEAYRPRRFKEASEELPKHDCFCSLVIRSYYSDSEETKEQVYGAMGYYLANENKFYYGYPAEGKHIDDGYEVFEFSAHQETHERNEDDFFKADDYDEIMDVLAWCEVDELSAIGSLEYTASKLSDILGGAFE